MSRISAGIMHIPKLASFNTEDIPIVKRIAGWRFFALTAALRSETILLTS